MATHRLKIADEWGPVVGPIRERLQRAMGDHRFRMWLGGAEFSLCLDLLIVRVHGRPALDWLRRNYQGVIEDAVKAADLRGLRLALADEMLGNEPESVAASASSGAFPVDLRGAGDLHERNLTESSPAPQLGR